MLWWGDMVQVASMSHENKMTPQNLAIVIGPNLFIPPMNIEPMAALKFSQRSVRLSVCLAVDLSVSVCGCLCFGGISCLHATCVNCMRVVWRTFCTRRFYGD